MEFEIYQEIKEIKEQKKRENELKEMEMALSIINKYNNEDEFEEYVDKNFPRKIDKNKYQQVLEAKIRRLKERIGVLEK